MKISGSGRFADGTVYQTTYEGVIPTLERRYNDPKISDFVKHDIERFMRVRECQECHGARLKPAVLAVTVHDLNIVDMCNLDVDATLEVLSQDLGFDESEEMIAKPILKEIRERVKFMQDVGLGYLELGRAANTLSGGEAQRIRLATQIGSGLQGVLYVLDEPSIGLHQRDNDKLIATLKHLRDLKNTVLVVEHDEDTMLSSDYIIDIGPGAGAKGGLLVAAGTPEEIMANPDSITGKYLSGEMTIATPKKRRKAKKGKEISLFVLTNATKSGKMEKMKQKGGEKMDRAKIGKRLKELRRAKGLSQVETAAKLHVSQSAIVAYETGARTPRDEVKLEYSRLFGVPIQNIFFE